MQGQKKEGRTRKGSIIWQKITSVSPFDARSKKRKNVHLDCGIKSFEWDVQSFRGDLSNVESLLRNSHANYDNISNKCPTGLSDEGLTFYVQKVKFAVTSQWFLAIIQQHNSGTEGQTVTIFHNWPGAKFETLILGSPPRNCTACADPAASRGGGGGGGAYLKQPLLF